MKDNTDHGVLERRPVPEHRPFQRDEIIFLIGHRYVTVACETWFLAVIRRTSCDVLSETGSVSVLCIAHLDWGPRQT